MKRYLILIFALLTTPSIAQVVRPNMVPNGSFIEGSYGQPIGWRTYNTGGALWTWHHDGLPYMEVQTFGPYPVRSGNLTSAQFVMAPSTAYTFSGEIRSIGVFGAWPLAVYAVECDGRGVPLLDAHGWALQHALVGDFGLSDWSEKSITFTTDPRCVQGFIYANLFGTGGTADLTALWLRPAR